MNKIKNYQNLILAFSIISLVLIRLIFAITFPNPLHIDEAKTMDHVQTMITEGTDANHRSWPIMSRSLGGGYTTSTYLYPLVIWSTVFGQSTGALRAFSQISTILAVFCLAGGLYFWQGKRLATISLIVGLSLPWSWANGLMAWDPAITPLFVSLSFLIFSYIANRSQARTLKINLLLSLLTFCSVLTAYSYPPARVTAPLLLGLGLIYLQAKKLLSISSWVTVTLTGILSSLPLLNFMLSDEALGRSNDLSVFRDSVPAGLWLLAINLLGLLDPTRLFVTGDSNLRHSFGFLGMLGIASIIPIGYTGYLLIKHALPSKIKPLLIISGVGILAGLLGSALTNEGQPHYLRATAAWPFFVILLSLGWYQIIKHKGRLMSISLLLGIIGLIGLIFWIFFVYPELSYDYFT
ncbi:hypothetical protein H6792_03580 [Candidatus Nomurabacteria bacterium]|nr:hypothetical protein [Candidatus Nomurabacteria bacterium]